MKLLIICLVWACVGYIARDLYEDYHSRKMAEKIFGESECTLDTSKSLEEPPK